MWIAGLAFSDHAPGVKQLCSLLWNYHKNFYL
jgi:hypothetical protein